MFRPIMVGARSIVSGKLISTGATKVTKSYSKEAAQKLSCLEKDVADFTQMCKADPADQLSAGLLEKAILKLKEFKSAVQKNVTTVRTYTDSKGAKYVETIERNGQKCPVRKLEKFEERYLSDGRKIETHTVHDKSDMHLLGEGHENGSITTIETIKNKEGIAIGRRTTTELGDPRYPGKTVMKELSLDGSELASVNTKTTVSYLDGNGIRTSKQVFEPGSLYPDYQLRYDKHGLSKYIKDGLDYGW